MSITAKVVADSISPKGARLTTFQLEYPKFIHGEIMTHREASRNASSSRAIPVEKQLARVANDPAMPVYWGANKPGMAATAELEGRDLAEARDLVLEMRDFCLARVQKLQQLGLHKQTANRYLEPWMHIGVVFTCCNFSNIFGLRYHKAAQPEFQALAKLMYQEYQASEPITRPLTGLYSFHLPYVSNEERRGVDDVSYMSFEGLKSGLKKVAEEETKYLLLRMSAARCARVTHLNHDGSNPTFQGDLKTFQTLMGGDVKHASPTEHQAWPSRSAKKRSGNLIGWTQFRKTIPGEYIQKFEGPLP